MYHKKHSLLLVLPADHSINDIEEFQKTLTKAIPYAMSGKLVTFGIAPLSQKQAMATLREGFSFKLFQ
jgi:mannose-1-phosphate guanylyltransferase